MEAAQLQNVPAHKPKLGWVFREKSWKIKNLFAVSQAGLINNLNDGMSWGVFPLLFISAGVGLEGVGWIKAVYPVVWGLGQIITEPLADRRGRKPLIVWGMFIQAIGHVVIGFEYFTPLVSSLTGSVLLGTGTAMVYPALLAAVSDAAHPAWRASSLGVYRLCRWCIDGRNCGGMLTFLSEILVWIRMKEAVNLQ